LQYIAEEHNPTEEE